MTIAVIAVIILFIVALIGVRYHVKCMANNVDDDIYQVFSELIGEEASAHMKALPDQSIKSNITLIKIVIGALIDTIQYFQSVYNIPINELSETCMKFAIKRCKESGVEINSDVEFFITKMLKVCLEQYKGR